MFQAEVRYANTVNMNEFRLPIKGIQRQWMELFK